MIEINFIRPPTLNAARAAGKLSAFAGASRTRRRSLVAATLIGADLGSGFVAARLAYLFTGTTFTIGMGAMPVLVLLFWFLDLYGGFGPCPYERLRLRVQGIILFGLADFATNIMVGGAPRPGFLALVCTLLLVAGYYVEIYARAILIRYHLWGGAAVFVGAGPQCGQLALYLREHPEFGLRPVGFVRTTQEGADRMPASVPALGEAEALKQFAPWIELLVFHSAADMAALSPALLRYLNARQMVMVGGSDNLPSLWLRTSQFGRADRRRVTPRGKEAEPAAEATGRPSGGRPSLRDCCAPHRPRGAGRQAR